MIKLNLIKIVSGVFGSLVMTSLAVAMEAPTTRCADWSTPVSFEQAVDEYMAQKAPDFGCLSRASWMATADLFKAENSQVYESRLKVFEAKYSRSGSAYEDLKVIFQLQWLSDNYEGMKNYKSSAVAKGVVGLTAGTLVLGGAAIVLRTPILTKMRTTARPALIRMAKYLAAIMFARTAISASSAGDPQGGHSGAKMQAPPFDILGGMIYVNYSDLHLMRDLATLTAEALTAGTVQATVSVLALRYLTSALLANKLVSVSTVVGFVVAYPLGKLAAYFTSKEITDQYHKLHEAETLELAKALQSSSVTDWQRYVLGAQLTNSALAWVSTQDLALQTSLEEMISDFRNHNICGRFREHTLAMVPQSRHPVPVRVRPFPDNKFQEAEIKLRAEIYQAIVDKTVRLNQVRNGVLERMKTLKKINKPYLKGFIVQHQALLDRLSVHLNHLGVYDAQLDIMRAQAATLVPGSSHWNDRAHLSQIASQNDCGPLPYSP